MTLFGQCPLPNKKPRNLSIPGVLWYNFAACAARFSLTPRLLVQLRGLHNSYYQQQLAMLTAWLDSRAV